MTRMPSTTGKDMEAGGQWAKVARKTYEHESGVVVAYDCNSWQWAIKGGAADGERYGVLWAARSRVESVARTLH